MQIYSPTITVMLKAARKAARGLMKDFGEVEHLQVSRKGPADFVSQADKRAEEVIISELQQARPGYSILAEESGLTKGDDPDHRWIIDPLDGTTNFLHGMPFFCIAIALEKQVYVGKKEIVAAVVEAPALKETYWAERGAGAWLERSDGARNAGGRLRVASRKNMEDALVAVGCAQFGGKDQHQMVDSLKGKVAGIRAMGAGVLELAYVAAGRSDIYFQHGEKPWDIAAGALLVREAGGYITDFKGKDNTLLEKGDVLAANDKLHGVFLKQFA